MWEKIYDFIRGGRLGEASTYAGISVLVVTVFMLLQMPLIDPATGEALTAPGLSDYMVNAGKHVWQLISGLASLMAKVRREEPKQLRERFKKK